ncbi:MAG: type II secretory pathway component PulJ [Planctomycetota bacterium]|jgi:type II secretory pathway component PulJ
MKLSNMIGKVRNDSGLSILETTVSMSIAAFIGVTLTVALSSTIDSEAIIGGRSEMESRGRSAVGFISKQLSLAGRMKDGVLNETFPRVFTADNPPAVVTTFGYDEFSGTITTQSDRLADELVDARLAGKYVGEEVVETVEDPPEAYVAPRNNPLPNGVKQILFKRPGDIDGDGTVFSKTTGRLEWADELVGFLMVPGIDDTFELVFRTYNLSDNKVTDKVLCRDVLAVSFDMTETRPTLPLNAIEVHLYLLGADKKGNAIKIHQSTTVLMRNS